jgi:hypothetical protein
MDDAHHILLVAAVVDRRHVLLVLLFVRTLNHVTIQQLSRDPILDYHVFVYSVGGVSDLLPVLPFETLIVFGIDSTSHL